MPFATADDVSTRLGRELTTPEEDQVTAVIDSVDGLIRSEVDRDADWDPDPVPAYLKELTIQKAIAAIVNPFNLASQSEQLGVFQHSETYQRAQDGGIALSEAEGRAVRSAVYGEAAGSARLKNPIDDVFDYADDGLVNDSVDS
jgi:hypothetical protein